MNLQDASIPVMEIGEAICKGVLNQYADPRGARKLSLEDGLKANREGIVMQYSPSVRRLRFRFLLRDIPDALVDVQYTVMDFLRDPEGFITNTHREMHRKMAEFHDRHRTRVMLLSNGGLQRAMRDVPGERLN